MRLFSIIRFNIRLLHCAKSVRIRSYSVRMRENADQNNSKYGNFLRSVNFRKICGIIEN